jgi:hypothetical protein
VRVYRGMKLNEEGLLKTGASARTLGARANIDILVDETGSVAPDTGGMSVSPPPLENLPEHRRPPELGGTGKTRFGS